MKKYLINIKKIQITNMLVNAKNKKTAIDKVSDLLMNNISDSTHLNKIFNEKPLFEFKLKKLNNKK